MFGPLVRGFIVGMFEGIGNILSRRQADKKRQLPDENRKESLIAMLNQGPEWRTFTRLMRRIGADKDTTLRLLSEIGAERSTTEADVWRLPPGHPRRRRP